MSEEPGPATSPGASADVPDESGSWLRRLIRRAVLGALGPEIGEFRSAIGEGARRSDRHQERASALERGLGNLVERLNDRSGIVDARLAEHAEWLGRLEAIVDRGDQAVREIGDLRGAFLEARADLESIRDARIPDLERRADALERDTIAAIQREMEALRDQRLPDLEQRIDSLTSGPVSSIQRELEMLRDQELPELERRVDQLSGGSVATIQREVEVLRDQRISGLEEAAGQAHAALEVVQSELDDLRSGRVAKVEEGIGRIHTDLVAVQDSLSEVRDQRFPHLEGDLATMQRANEGVQGVVEELRDKRLPALASRVDVLLSRLHEELTATAGLVDRMLAGEPLRVVGDPAVEVELPEAVRLASASFLETFRGSRDEIAGRVVEYVELLADSAPVLDVGCGRGELLVALRDAAVQASGVDSDPAMVAACRSEGLEVVEGEGLDVLLATPGGSLGGVTAVHVIEHLPAAAWMRLIDLAARALRSGGLLVVESPNPDALRVGAGLFWTDPTHKAPVHPDAVAFVARAVGLEVLETRFRRPFPAEQNLAHDDQPDQLRRLATRLDHWLSGPRDYAVIARKP